ncbi:uncharacterized protein A4U43_C08F23580 [Asparagus officinalis]|nr:uncharacterized protein A4U43_C08F23580 [Asparagus officinalis]
MQSHTLYKYHQFSLSTFRQPKMATYTSSQALWGLVITLLMTSVSSQVPTPPKRSHGKFTPGPWISSHATFYGGADGSETTGGSCGYQDTEAQGYGLQTAALSSVLYKSLHEIKCGWHARKRGKPSTGSRLCVTPQTGAPRSYRQAS